MLRIFVRPTAKASIDAYAEAEGMTQTAVASRLFEFFETMPEILQDWMLGKVPREMRAQTAERIAAYFRQVAEDEAVPLEERGHLIPPIPEAEPEPSTPAQTVPRKRQRS